MLKLHVFLSEVFSHQFVQSKHVLHKNYRVSVPCCGWPSESMLTLLYLHLGCRGVGAVELLFEFLICAFFCHPARYRARLLFYHCKMLDVLMRIEKQLTCVQLNHYASHWPNVAGLIPHQVFQDDLRSSILSSVDNQSVAFVVVSRTTEVNHTNIRTNWTVPRVNLRLRSGNLATWKARRGIAFTLIWAVNFLFC